jgi:hypothetical protein
MSETEKQKKTRYHIQNLRDINRVLRRKLEGTQKYLLQEIKNVKAERDWYKVKFEELSMELEIEKVENLGGDFTIPSGRTSGTGQN